MNGTAALARAVVAGVATDLPETAISDAQLLITEVVANAITHAGLGPSDVITLRVTADGYVRVDVFDPGPMFDADSRQPKTQGGWGLFLLDTLATSWGIERGDAGKHVWFEIRAPDGAGREE